MSAGYMPQAMATDARCGIRVAFFSDSLPERNGTGAYYHDLVAHLTGEVGAVDIIQPRPRSGRMRLAVPLPGDSTQALVAPNLWRVHRQLRDLHPTVIVSVTPGPFGLLGQWIARRHGCGFITAYHTHFEGLAGLYWGRYRGDIALRAIRGVNRFLCRRSATVLATSASFAETLKDLGAAQVDVVGTPLDERFLTDPRMPEPGPLKTVCFAGRLASEKNIEAVVDAARHHRDVRFLIGGDGPQRQQVEAAARELDNLQYLGWLERPQLRDMIDESQLLVLPSRQETFGSVALEAMARARPVLVSEQAGICDWPELRDGLFRLTSRENLAEALVRLRAMPERRLAATGRAGRSVATTLNATTVADWCRILATHQREAA